MCAIAGEINYISKVSPDRTIQMLDSMNHRGPDGRGFFTSEKVYFGMNRLAIIDVQGGKQPLYNEDDTIVAVGNGEIYNYIELQKSLTAAGHVLKTGSDIETSVHLYEDYGENFAKYLRGMFAICIFDKKNNKVILARDRLGEKPLYYHDDGQRFIFASELKAFMVIDSINKTVDKSKFVEYMQLSYTTGNNTVFRNIKRLPPASIISINIKNKRTHISKYWNLSKYKIEKSKDIYAKIHQTISESSSMAARADVPVAISLSGGIDSSAVLALTNKNNGLTASYSVGYEGRPKSDERNEAKRIARYFNIKNKDCEISNKEFIKKFPQTVFYCDEPIADLAAYSIFKVSELCKKNKTKVLLSGLGGDEYFWGYKWVSDVTEKFVNGKYKACSIHKYSRNYRNYKLFTEKILYKEFRKDTAAHKSVQTQLTLDAKGVMIQLIETWLTNNCLTLADRLSMASSVEMRSPLVDYKIAQMSLTSKEILSGYRKSNKYYLRRALKNILPGFIINAKKRGFNPPAIKWLPSIISAYSKYLNNGYLVQNKILDAKRIKILLATWRLMPIFWENVYHLIVLEIWCRIYIWGKNPKDL